MKFRTSFLTLLCGSFFGGAAAQMVPNMASAPAYALTVWLSLIGSVSGTQTGQFAINNISVTGDTTSNTNHTISSLNVGHAFGGPAALGSFIGVFGTVTQTAATGNTASVGSPNGQYIGGEFGGSALANDNGTGGSPQGILFGVNSNVSLTTAATNWMGLVGIETDVAVDANSSVADLIGQQIVQTSTHVTKGSRSNIGLSFNNATGVPGWDCGLCFGAFSGFNPMASGSTLIGTFNHAGSVGGGSMGTVANGVDFRQYTFTGTPFGAPLMTPASSSASCVTGGIEWDAGFVYICTATNTWKRATLATF